MYPYRLFLDIDLYTVFLCLAVAGAIINFRFFAEKRKMSWKLSNLVVVSAAAAILFGYFSAVLFQALYNVEKLGKFVIDTSTGATFYGGLIGGAACFLLFYFVVGGFVFKDGEHVKGFFAVADIASASIVIAHAFGRIGCLMAGCCHGGATDKWYGIYMSAWGERVVPTQLYEAIFLFALYGFLVWRMLKRQSYGLPIYMAVYGAWRFAIEFVRKDYRGSTLVDFLTPSQFIAILMIAGACIVFLAQKAFIQKEKKLTEVKEYED